MANVKPNEEEIVDKMSSLPDDILRHILSFLPSHYSIRISFLSTRFRYIWRSVPILDFQDNHYPINTFEKIMDNALKNHEDLSRVRKFRLWCFDFEYRKTTISRWIDLCTTATSSNLEELDICLYQLYRLNLPYTVFSCSKLKTLRLSGGIIVDNIPTDVHVFFPCLKTLRLKSISIIGCNTLNKLLSGCPRLEIFYIRDCLFKRSSTDINAREITINKLYLEYLKPRIYGDSYCANSVLSLASASIDVIDFDLLKIISNMVKQLELCKANDVIYTNSHDNPPVLRNLTHLVVKAKKDMYASPALRFLLDHSPNLTCLVLEKSFPYKDFGQDMWNLPPTVSYYNLETVQINGFIGVKEVEFVKYFLKNALVLKKLILCVARARVISNEIKASILDEPRVSSQCEILFIHSIN